MNSSIEHGNPIKRLGLILVFMGLLVVVAFFVFNPSGTMTLGNASKPPLPDFTDVTELAGVDFVHENGARGGKWLPETMGGGVAFVDWDQDGDADLVFVNGSRWSWDESGAEPESSVVFYRNDSNPLEGIRMTRVQEFDFFFKDFQGMGVACGDFDSDGWTDLYITGLGRNRLLRNLEGTGWIDVTDSMGGGGESTAWSTSAVFADGDGDGDLDLLVCNYVQWNREIDEQINYRLGVIGRAYGPPMDYSGTQPYYFRNEDARFVEVAGESGFHVNQPGSEEPLGKGLGVIATDLNQDGWTDFVVANDTVRNFVFRNNQDGTFSEIGVETGVAFDNFGATRGAMGIDMAWLEDGGADDLALAIGNFANEMTALYVMETPELFFADQAIQRGVGTSSAEALTFGVCFFDYDLDGKLDLLTANGHIENRIAELGSGQTYQQPAHLFRNRSGAAQGEFFEWVNASWSVEDTDLFQPVVGRGAAYADLDLDGDLDLIITQVGERPLLLRNNLNQAGRSVRITLKGSDQNPEALGAIVTARISGRDTRRTITPTRGYLSQSELPVTVGLGQSGRLEKIVVQWPDGREQTVLDPPQSGAITIVYSD